MTSSPLLQLDAISQRYARHSVVEQLSLSLQRGEIGCLLGSSGCGKTTVLRCIAGFEPLSGGRILIDGQLLADARLHTPAHKRYIGMVFQDYGLFARRPRGAGGAHAGAGWPGWPGAALPA